jgi:predicted GH43/DUF377 family glycosyl hydrolase
MLDVIRSPHNPLLRPNWENAFEAAATFNGCPVKTGTGKAVTMVYRALSEPQFYEGVEIMLSVVGKAESKDGVSFAKTAPFIVPEESWERYGCEDPRVTKIGDTYYIFYTALSTFPFGPDGITVGLATTTDLKKIDAKHHVTHFNSKAMTLFPKKIGGKFAALLSVNTDRPPATIALAFFEKESDMWSEEYWRNFYDGLSDHAIDLSKRSGDHVEIGAPPLETSKGWLLIYSHIYHYGTAQQVFGIEAVLLDKKDPKKILGRTATPLIMPQENYELYGMVDNITFPSGAYIEGDDLHIYYGAADTTVCRATTPLARLLEDMLQPEGEIVFDRAKENPILTPVAEHAWEDKAVFNPAAFLEDGKIHLVYRAMGHEDTSVMGYAVLSDIATIEERLPEPIYVPREIFEQKLNPGNSGCEDARITRIDNTYYMCYTAFDAVNPPRVAMTTISVNAFKERRFDEWTTPVLISSPGTDDKDAAIFPEKINGHYVFLHRFQPNIDLCYVEHLVALDGKNFLPRNPIMRPRPGMWDDLKIGISSTPLKTKKGWLLLYHGVSSEDHRYRVGAALLDLKDPEKVIGRTDAPLFTPEMPYELEGIVPNVVFPCGSVIIGSKLVIYYGGADTVIGVATISLAKLLTHILKD